MPILSTPQGPAAAPSVRGMPSLATDLAWLLMTASSPSCRTNYLERVDPNPPPASMCGGAALAFDESPGLAERVRTFWGDTDEETSLTELQILAHHVGAFDATDPEVLWAALER